MRGTGSRPRGTSVPVAVALGSNVGDRLAHLRLGRRRLAAWLEGLRCSRIYETDPQYVSEQERFLNACCVGCTTLSARELLRRLQEVETEAGRKPNGLRFGPRPLDIDLLLYGDRVLRRPELRVPHPRMTERAFVLVPLAEVAPDWPHPTEGLPIAELARRVPAHGVERAGDWVDAP